MSKKLLTLITFIVLLLVILGGGFFIYLYTKNTSPEGARPGIIETLKQVNPFGESDPLGLSKVVDKIVPDNIFNSSTDDATNQPTSVQVLFKLSNERSSGVGFADVLIPKTIEVRKKILIDDPLQASSSKPRKISVMATTSEVIYATSSRIRFVQQSSGHIFEYDYASSTSRKLTNTTIPKTQEAYFLDKGSKVLLRYMDNNNKSIENYLATIPVSSVTDSLTGKFLPNNILHVAVAPSTNEFLYTAKTSSGSVGNVYNTKNETERRVFSSPFSEWLPEWRSTNVFLTTKAHSSYKGVVYTQSLSKNTLSRVLGGINGLTTLPSPNGTKILVGNGYNLSLMNIGSSSATSIPNIYTVPEKCLWTSEESILCFGQENDPGGRFPETWYQGKVSFNDSLFEINSNTGYMYKVASMSELYGSTVYVDAYKLTASNDNTILAFINKVDMTPWYINLSTLYSYLEGGLHSDEPTNQE